MLCREVQSRDDKRWGRDLALETPQPQTVHKWSNKEIQYWRCHPWKPVCPETKYPMYVKIQERCNVEPHNAKKGASCGTTDFITEPVFLAQIWEASSRCLTALYSYPAILQEQRSVFHYFFPAASNNSPEPTEDHCAKQPICLAPHDIFAQASPLH